MSPDGLEMAELELTTVEKVLLGRLWVVFGKVVVKAEGVVDGGLELAADDCADEVVEEEVADEPAEVVFEPGPETIVVRSPLSTYTPLKKKFSVASV
jgi:hypothetical protein